MRSGAWIFALALLGCESKMEGADLADSALIGSVGVLAPSSLSARFPVDLLDAATAHCEKETIAECQVLSCPVGGAADLGDGSGNGGGGAAPHAGTLQVTGGLMTLAMSPSADGTYYGVSSAQEIFFPG